MTDDQFEQFIANQPKRSKEEMDNDLEEFMNHPLNCKDLTPE
jgi:hypothetical protein